MEDDICYLSEIIRLDISRESSTRSHEMSILIFTEKYFKVSSSADVIIASRVKSYKKRLD